MAKKTIAEMRTELEGLKARLDAYEKLGQPAIIKEKLMKFDRIITQVQMVKQSLEIVGN